MNERITLSGENKEQVPISSNLLPVYKELIKTKNKKQQDALMVDIVRIELQKILILASSSLKWVGSDEYEIARARDTFYFHTIPSLIKDTSLQDFNSGDYKEVQYAQLAIALAHRNIALLKKDKKQVTRWEKFIEKNKGRIWMKNRELFIERFSSLYRDEVTESSPSRPNTYIKGMSAWLHTRKNGIKEAMQKSQRYEMIKKGGLLAIGCLSISLMWGEFSQLNESSHSNNSSQTLIVAAPRVLTESSVQENIPSGAIVYQKIQTEGPKKTESHIVTVKRGDTVWGILKNTVASDSVYQDRFAQLSVRQQNGLIYHLVQQTALHKRDIGISHIDRIYRGQKLHFSSVLDTFDSSFAKVSKLSS